MSINLQKVLTTLEEISKIAPVFVAAAGLSTTGVISDIVEALPEVESALAQLLAIFSKHAEHIQNTTAT